MSGKTLGLLTLFWTLCAHILVNTPSSFVPLPLFISRGKAVFIFTSLLVIAAVFVQFMTPIKNYYARLSLHIFSMALIIFGFLGFLDSLLAISFYGELLKPLDYLLMAQAGIISGLALVAYPVKVKKPAGNTIKIRLLSPSIPVAYYYRVQQLATKA